MSHVIEYYTLKAKSLVKEKQVDNVRLRKTKLEEDKKKSEKKMLSEGATVTAVMVTAQFLEMGGNTLIKAATNDGMSIYVFTFYSNLFALCLLLPSTLFYHRKRAPPPISTSIYCRFFLLSCLSTSVQIMMNTGIRYSSPTLASAMVDLVPAFTFILAVISRIENLNLKQHSSQVKIIGTMISIIGALIVTLYKGTPLINHVFHNIKVGASGMIPLTWNSDWILGAFLLANAGFFLSVLFITQTWIIRDYPEELVVTTICCSLVVILSAIVALIIEGYSKIWILRPNKELASICYSAIFIVSMRSVVYAWAFRKKGPIYVAMFNPLGMVIALAMGVIFLGDNLYLGSMIGATIIAIGFYAVMWAQAQEEHITSQNNNSKFPLASLLLD